jgi:hypothetical protein
VLAGQRIPYSNERAPTGSVAFVKVGGTTLAAFDGTQLSAGDFKSRSAQFKKQLSGMLEDAGYPASADPQNARLLDGVPAAVVMGVLGSSPMARSQRGS